jgi:cytochrome c-type biogenesis protein
MGGAFTAGAAAVFSPGLALLLPGYAAFIAACSLHTGSGTQTTLSTIFPIVAGFIAGFSLVFVALGATGTVLGGFLIEYLALLVSVAGIVLTLVGLFAIRAPRTGRRWVPLLGVVVGLSFAIGWKPTIDPALAAGLIAAAQPDSRILGIARLSTYALGLAVPLLIVALAMNEAVARGRRFGRAISLVSGTLIIATGVLIFTNR